MYPVASYVMHGVMFHHFHSAEHASRPGSFSSDDFSRALDLLEKESTIVSPDTFFGLLRKGDLRGDYVLLTFDDALMSQFDVAEPVLADRGLTGAFAIYSSLYGGSPDPLEIFAAFRNEAFADFAEFWTAFSSEQAVESHSAVRKADAAVGEGFLSEFAFYSREEKLFRFVRDEILTTEEYQFLMWSMIENCPAFDAEATAARLWMGTEHLEQLISLGHSVGLHSHTHPTRMDLLDEQTQQDEYYTNFEWLSKNLGVAAQFVAHPCGRYNNNTLRVLDGLGVKYGFRSTMGDGVIHSKLEVPREDSATLLSKL